jgi:Fur family ferric uptake transcriptional regulator
VITGAGCGIAALACPPLGLDRILDSVQNSCWYCAVTDDVDELLRHHGMQVTAQRLAIMRAVSSRPHATADALADDVRSVIGSISRQAVYDTLGVLVDKNLIRRIQPAGSAARYEDRVGDNHHHLICRACGAMFDIDCAVGEVPCLTADDDHGFEIDEAEVVYWGHCPTCRTATAGAEAPAAARTASSENSERGSTAGQTKK